MRDGSSTEAGSEELDPDASGAEMLGLALRTRSGAPVDALDRAVVYELIGAGLLSVDGGRVVLTRTGRLLANEVVLRLAA